MRNLIKKANPTLEERKVWRKLIQKEILEADDEDRVRFQVPLIKESIIQKIEEEL